MSIAVSIEGVGKKYRVQHAAERAEYETLRETIGRAASAPWRRLREGPAGKCEDFWALRDISLKIDHGEAIGIIGRNGAGKSTLLKILSQITKPTTGCVKLYGRVASLLEVGTGFHPELTGRENIFLNGSILGMRRAEIQRKFDEIVDFAGVERFLDTPIKRYSSGMKVRLAFAVAAHLEPEVLIIDEVLAVGDAEFQKKCIGKMNDVAHSGRTVLFVSHNLAAVQSLCERAILVSDGRVSRDGGQREVVDHYLRTIQATGMPGRYVAVGAAYSTPRVREAIVRSEGQYSESGYPTGHPLDFEVRCDAGSLTGLPALGIGIDNAMGDRIVTVHSGICRLDSVDEVPSQWITFRCRISGLLLQPGDYFVKISYEAASQPLDVLTPAFMFAIRPAGHDTGGGGSRRGMVLCDQDWQLARE